MALALNYKTLSLTLTSGLETVGLVNITGTFVLVSFVVI